MLRMSKDTQEVFKIIIGILVSVAGFALWMVISSYVATQKENKEKLDQIYIAVITQNIRDSLQTNTIAQMRAETAIHDKETDKAIQTLLMSMVRANIQIVEADRQLQLKQNDQ